MPTLNEFFDLVRIINLPDRTDRRRAVERELAALGLPLTPGKVELFPAQRITDAAGFPSPGVRGCFLSHLGVLRNARARGVRNVLIAEDDIELPPANIPLLRALFDQPCDPAWGILHLGHIQPLPAVPTPRLTPYTGPVGAAHLYAVNAPVFTPLIDYLEACLTRPPGDPIGGPMHYDGALTMFRAANPHILTLLAQPSLATQRASRSDISFRSFERLPVLKQVMTLARAARSIIRKR